MKFVVKKDIAYIFIKGKPNDEKEKRKFSIFRNFADEIFAQLESKLRQIHFKSSPRYRSDMNTKSKAQNSKNLGMRLIIMTATG